MSIKRAIDPIFAPITYGSDRQVTRTRRGLNDICEMRLDVNIVYCECMSCDYKWELSKNDYIGGTGGTSPRIDEVKDKLKRGYDTFLDYLPRNIGTGGTGTPDMFTWVEYRDFNHYAHDCCTGGVGLCAYDGQMVKVADFYKLTGCTGESGELIEYFDTTSSSYIGLGHELGTGGNGGIIGDTGSSCLSESIPIYMQCQGASGEGIPNPRMFGGYPVICPNCCRVNFKAYWREELDNPGKKLVEFEDPVELKNNWKFNKPRDTVAEIGDPSFIQDPCKCIIVTDFQRIKTDFNLGHI